MSRYTALFDANVLYKIAVTDIILEIAATGLFRARWTEEIHDEWIRNLLKNNPKLDSQHLEKRKMYMSQHGQNVSGYESIIGSLNLPDENDNHVLAAAITGRVDAIITFNKKDFPTEHLDPYGLECLSPDEFLYYQFTLEPALIIRCAREVRSRLKKKKYTAEAYLSNLQRNGLHLFATALEDYCDLI